MPDNERDQAIEQAAKVLIDVSTEDATADAYDMARALDREGLLRSGGDTGDWEVFTASDGQKSIRMTDRAAEVAKLRAERDWLQRWKDEA